ncbi:MAG: site-2 protease family protein [Chloroflexota bacterium]
MQRGLSLGRLFGIEIRVDWSWLLIFFLIAWNLSVAFNQIYPDRGLGLAWGLAIVAALLFFASVLAHEMAHSLMARQQDVQVRSITLFLFGGVADIQREPPSPKAEFLITIVGPLVSIALGGALLIIANLIIAVVEPVNGTPALSDISPFATLLVWLGSINIVLAVFNMIPGFPLDGGRILRSALWAITDNLRKATRWASWAGQTFAWLLIISGVAMIFGIAVPVFGSGGIGGLWLIFIGWFLNSAAIQSYRRIVIQDLLSDVPVQQIMRSDPPTVPTGITVQELVDNYMMRTDDHAFPVVDDAQLVGFVTLDDIRSVPRADWSSRQVSDVMTRADDLETVSPDADSSDAMTRLMQRDVRQLPVVEDGRRLTGVLRRADIIKWLRLQSDLSFA